MRDLLQEFTGNIELLPAEFRLKPVVDYTLEMLKISGLEHEQIDPNLIFLTKDGFNYFIKVESYTKVLYGINRLDGTNLNNDTFKDYSTFSTIKDLPEFLNKVQANYWSFIPIMYEDIKELSKKYSGNYSGFKNMFNLYFGK